MQFFDSLKHFSGVSIKCSTSILEAVICESDIRSTVDEYKAAAVKFRCATIGVRPFSYL